MRTIVAVLFLFIFFYGSRCGPSSFRRYLSDKIRQSPRSTKYAMIDNDKIEVTKPSPLSRLWEETFKILLDFLVSSCVCLS
uniref:Putative secreted protein n=1 Tax=Anopheles marajoara TaxID=58244 RepID=A0A2M4CBJ7_9DIPT